MNKTVFLALAVVSMLAIKAEAQAIPAAAACDSLAGVALKNVAITAAQRVAAGDFQPSSGRAISGPLSYKNLAAFCRVAATVTPSPDSEIRIEVWLPVLHAAALGACDTLDGVEDGVIENPQVCRFDPQVLLCNGADKSSCLTAPQVEVARRIYRGVTNVSSGEPLFPGLQPGSESGWASLSGPKPHAMSLEVFRYLVHQDADWDAATFNAETDIPLAEKRIGPLFDAVDPNIKPFVERGGKLLMYHGWADPNVSPGNSVNYYQNVVSALGAPAAATSVRLFMVPGMGHCSGGDGTDVFDAIGALDQWVEKAKTPDSIPASHLITDVVATTRQLCAYPQTAQYKGVGSTIVAASFTCK